MNKDVLLPFPFEMPMSGEVPTPTEFEEKQKTEGGKQKAERFIAQKPRDAEEYLDSAGRPFG